MRCKTIIRPVVFLGALPVSERCALKKNLFSTKLTLVRKWCAYLNVCIPHSMVVYYTRSNGPFLAHFCQFGLLENVCFLY